MRRLFSLSGVIPLGAFVLFHFADVGRSLAGPETFAVGFVSDSHVLLVLDTCLIGIPLAFHALYGLKLSLTSRVDVAHYPHTFGWAHALQRLSGGVAFAFLLWHLWQMRVRVLLGQRGPADYYNDLAAGLSSTSLFGIPLVALAYLAGVAAVSYHLANGVAGFSASFGLVRSQAGYRRLARYCMAAGLGVFLLGASSVIHFATGWTPIR